MPTVLEIVADYLREQEQDGLCNPETECGCGVDDLAPCGDYCPSDCVPAVKGGIADVCRFVPAQPTKPESTSR